MHVDVRTSGKKNGYTWKTWPQIMWFMPENSVCFCLLYRIQKNGLVVCGRRRRRCGCGGRGVGWNEANEVNENDISDIAEVINFYDAGRNTSFGHGILFTKHVCNLISECKWEARGRVSRALFLLNNGYCMENGISNDFCVGWFLSCMWKPNMRTWFLNNLKLNDRIRSFIIKFATSLSNHKYLAITILINHWIEFRHSQSTGGWWRGDMRRKKSTRMMGIYISNRSHTPKWSISTVWKP